MPLLKTRVHLLPCIFWTGEILIEDPEYAYLKALGFKKNVAKYRTFITETLSFDYIDNQGITERSYIFKN